jgi:uncharacterized protein
VLSLDTNILFPAVVKSHAKHAKAVAFLTSLVNRSDVAISEFVLLELYVLLRNPIVMPSPLGAEAAVEACQAFRRHPQWQISGFPDGSAQFHNRFWIRIGKDPFARRRAFDCRMAMTLLHFGVDEFATENIKDFEDLGFNRVWNPLLARI